MSQAFENFDLYEELEVKKTSSQEEIKKSYRKLAMVLNIYYRNERFL
jgi:curved DNA-binding protein CbpA